MAEISASMVMDLRQRTGLGMMECKKALTESRGRPRQGRGTAAHQERRQGVEGRRPRGRRRRRRRIPRAGRQAGRDGRSQLRDRLRFAQRGFRGVREGTGSTGRREESGRCRRAGRAAADGGTVESVRQALVQKIGENMSIRRFVRFTTPARLVQYLHGGGRVGVTVEFEGGDDAVGKDVAMHIAASHRQHPPRLRVEGSGSGRSDREGARDLHGAGRGQRQAGGHRRQDGRGPRQQVPGGESRCWASRSSRIPTTRSRST